jgi:ligand-binding sensor domain-containing protein
MPLNAIFLDAHKPSDNLKVPAYTNIRLFETSDKQLYALDDHSIYKFSPIKNKFENIYFDFKNNNVVPRSIIEDKDSTWWIASSSGIIHLNIRDGILDESKLKSLNKKYFKADQLYCLLPYDADRMWIGSGNNGLFLFNKKNN